MRIIGAILDTLLMVICWGIAITLLACWSMGGLIVFDYENATQIIIDKEAIREQALDYQDTARELVHKIRREFKHEKP